eukprot:SAG31_NODE_15054_length_773_cov_0.783383_1_plen_53_part_10
MPAMLGPHRSETTEIASISADPRIRGKAEDHSIHCTAVHSEYPPDNPDPGSLS